MNERTPSVAVQPFGRPVLRGTFNSFRSQPCVHVLIETAAYNKNIFQTIIFLYSPCHYMRAWIHVLDVPGCYERMAQAERKSTLQDSGLVRTVGPCAQNRVPQAIATARDALSNDRRESATCFKRPAKQVLALATEPRAKREVRFVLYHTCQ